MIELHRSDPFGTHVRGEQDVRVETFCKQLILQIGMIRFVPQVFVFTRIVLQIEQFADPLSMIDAELVPAGAVHGGKGTASSCEVRVEGIEICATDEISVILLIRFAG